MVVGQGRGIVDDLRPSQVLMHARGLLRMNFALLPAEGVRVLLMADYESRLRGGVHRLLSRGPYQVMALAGGEAALDLLLAGHRVNLAFSRALEALSTSEWLAGRAGSR